MDSALFFISSRYFFILPLYQFKENKNSGNFVFQFGLKYHFQNFWKYQLIFFQNAYQSNYFSTLGLAYYFTFSNSSLCYFSFYSDFSLYSSSIYYSFNFTNLSFSCISSFFFISSVFSFVFCSKSYSVSFSFYSCDSRLLCKSYFSESKDEK